VTSRAICASAGGAHDEASTGVDGRAGYGVARGHLDRHRLAGEQRRVDRRRAQLHDAVGCDLLARADHEPIADGELFDRDADFLAVTQHGDVLGAELEQRPQGGARTALGAALEVTPGEDEGDHDGGHFEVDLVGPAAGGRGDVESHPHRRVAGFADEECPQRPGQGGQRPGRDEGVHRCRGVAHVEPRRAVERPAAPDHHGAGERQ
jgi:hypothetical protein